MVDTFTADMQDAFMMSTFQESPINFSGFVFPHQEPAQPLLPAASDGVAGTSAGETAAMGSFPGHTGLHGESQAAKTPRSAQSKSELSMLGQAMEGAEGGRGCKRKAPKPEDGDKEDEAEELTEQIKKHKARSRYWYERCRSLEQQGARLEPQSLQFRYVCKTMKNWQKEFSKSQEQMRQANRSIEKSFAVLKDSLFSKSSAGTAALNKGTERGANAEDSDAASSSRTPSRNHKSSAQAGAGCSSGPMTCPSGERDRATKQRGAAAAKSVAAQAGTAGKQPAKQTAASASDSKPPASAAQRPAVASRKERAAIGKKYAEAVKAKRNTRNRAGLEGECKRTMEEIQNCQ